MEQVYLDTAKKMKALSDPKRLRIVDMLSCGELCACQILEEFHITQPTLSHDMKVLVESGLLRERRDGKNIYYSLIDKNTDDTVNILKTIFSPQENCICLK